MGDQPSHEEAAPAGRGNGADRRRPERAIWLGGALVVFAALVVGGMIVAGVGEDSDPEGLQQADGVVVHLDDDRLILRLSEPVEGREQLELTIGETAREELEHIEYHRTVGDLFRVYYERDGDDYVVREVADLPGLGH